MSDTERRFHETWLGMVQPIDGLVVSVPVLVDAQCMERQPPETQAKLCDLCPAPLLADRDDGPEGRRIADLPRFLGELLGLSPTMFDRGADLPAELSLYVPEGRQVLRPTLALRKAEPPPPADRADATPASRAGALYEMLVWDVPAGVDLDRPETETGPWDYPPAAKLDRLLRHCRVPIGLLTNREIVRLVYAPHGESSGAITFRVDDMATVGGRPILDAFVMLLSANRFFGVAEARSLPALLAESRKRQANVTTDLADQVFEALSILLRGFEAGAERDGFALLDDALGRSNDHLYRGLLTVLLRLVFVLYAEDRGLMPVEHPFYENHFSVLALFEDLRADQGAHPDSMARRFGAWGRLVALFRAVYRGVEHGTLRMPPRRGALFDPHTYPFLEGWGPAGSAPIDNPEQQAAVRVPTVDDGTVYRVLERLLILDGQRLSYRALDVEQIGSVYEALMGYHVVRVPAPAICMRPDGLWVSAEEVLEVPHNRRAKWLKETVGLATAQAEKLAQEVAAAGDATAALEALARYAVGGKKADPAMWRAKAERLVLQPGTERRRTSSHYTPRSLSEPIVRRTLEPLLAVMGEAPSSDRILNLKVCDPAMGSGAFLVEACRFLADAVVAAWTREGRLEHITATHGEALAHARRLVAQRCLYGVDKNEAAVELAKLSLWLVTLARELPFTFVDHALCHGDSLVGLDFDQIRSFHWKPGAQLELFTRELEDALGEAIALRQRILDLANQEDVVSQREKERLLWDAQDALNRVRLIGDVVVGAFFAKEKDKDREAERVRRRDLVTEWLRSKEPPTDELVAMQAEIRERIQVFHWMVELPEVFYAERPDPLDQNQVNRAAYMDAFVGNPPFAGKNAITEGNGDGYVDWLMDQYVSFGNTDLCAYFFRQTARLLGMHGTIGLIATNTIAQGDTRESSLKWLVQHGATIYEAQKSREWPGVAAVQVSVVHLAFGSARSAVRRDCVLDGARVNAVNSRLLPGPERPDPAILSANRGLDYMGGKLIGNGFVLTPAERDGLIQKDSKNESIIRPYMGGEDVNTSPDGSPLRYTINFGTMSLEEARCWPDLLKIAEEKVLPEREKNNRSTYRTYWWRPGETAGALYDALDGLDRCLVVSRVTKHLAFSFQRTDNVFSEQVYVFALSSTSAFAVLQSRAHEVWSRLLSSSMRTDLRYSASDCFETFPFPQPDPCALIPSLEQVGQRVYDHRAKYMVDRRVGLTITYNRLKDPRWNEPEVFELRHLHEEMDRAVLDAYGWPDIPVPPYCPTDADEQALERFQDKVIDRLFVLNLNRAEEEKRRGLAPPGAKQKTARKGTAPTSGRAPPKTATAQTTLLLGDPTPPGDPSVSASSGLPNDGAAPDDPSSRPSSPDSSSPMDSAPPPVRSTPADVRPPPSLASPPKRVVLLHAREDEALTAELRSHLAVLAHSGKATFWDRQHIGAGEVAQQAFDEQLKAADIVVPLLSADYLARYHAELEHALSLEAGGKRVVPVLLRPCTWEHTALRGRNLCLEEGAAGTRPDRDTAWKEVTTIITNTLAGGIKLPRRKPLSNPPAAPDPKTALLEDALARLNALRRAGADDRETLQEVLALKRALREGGQIKPGDSLGKDPVGEDRFFLRRRVGGGGFATVWEADDRRHGSRVAVKVLHPNLAGDRVRRRRFERGAERMAALHHPGIVRVVEPVTEDGGFLYFVMEFLPGGDLHQAVLAKKIKERDIAPIISRVSEALSHAHAAGCVHRDVKPHNIVLDDEGQPRLTDFDLVAAPDTTGATRAGAGLGTFAYAAPEALEDPQEADLRADVYSLGMTTAFCYHGRDPVIGVLENRQTFIHALPCSPEIRSVLARAVAWNRDERYPSVTDFAAALRRAATARKAR